MQKRKVYGLNLYFSLCQSYNQFTDYIITTQIHKFHLFFFFNNLLYLGHTYLEPYISIILMSTFPFCSDLSYLLYVKLLFIVKGLYPTFF